MGRLKSVGARLGRVAPRLGQAIDSRDEQRSVGAAWRSWYGTARWKRLRMAVLMRDRFTCRMCGAVEGDLSKLVADHVIPHRGRERMFWDEDNLQCLCRVCHDSAKQREEQAQVRRAVR